MHSVPMYVMVCSTKPPYYVHVYGTVIKGLRETGRGWVRYKGREGIVWGLVGVLEGLDEYPTFVRLCIRP